MPKKTSPLKDEAQKLYSQGFSTKEIAEKLKKPLRSVQRWVRECASTEKNNLWESKAASGNESFSIKEQVPIGVEGLTLADVEDSRVRGIIEDIRGLRTPECVNFNLCLLTWESLSYNRAIMNQSFELLTKELSKDEDSMSLNKIKTFSAVMTKHQDGIEKTSKGFDINWAVDLLTKAGYAILPEQDLKELINQREFDSYHILRREE